MNLKLSSKPTLFHEFHFVVGTREERGLTAWNQKQAGGHDDVTSSSTYDLPFGMSYILKWSWTRYIPLCPTFNVKCNCCSREAKHVNKADDTRLNTGDHSQGQCDDQGKIRRRQNDPNSTSF